MTVSLDYAIIFRVLGAFLWGVLYALFLEMTRFGRFLAEDRTWLSVVIGVGADLLISYPGGWFTVVAVVAASGIPIVARSLLIAAHEGEEVLGRNKLKWLLEDGIGYSNELVELLDQALDPKRQEKIVHVLSKALRVAHQLGALLRDGRSGRYDQRRSI